MTKSELKDLVKGHFNLVEKSENFAEATLEDGTKVTNDMADEFAEGQALKVITADGEKVAAPEGDHVTESGIVVTVDAEGIITGLKRPDEEGEGSADLAEEVETIEEDMSETVEEVEETTEETVTEEMADHEEDKAKMEEMPSLEEIMEVVGDVLEEKMGVYDEKIKMMEEEMKEIKDKMSAFASEPAEEKTIPTTGKKFNSQGFTTAKAEKTYNQLLNKIENKK